MTAESVLRFPRWTCSPLNTASWFWEEYLLYFCFPFPFSKDALPRCPPLSQAELGGGQFSVLHPQGKEQTIGRAQCPHCCGHHSSALCTKPLVWCEPQRRRAHQATFNCYSTGFSQRKSCRANSIQVQLQWAKGHNGLLQKLFCWQDVFFFLPSRDPSNSSCGLKNTNVLENQRANRSTQLFTDHWQTLLPPLIARGNGENVYLYFLSHKMISLAKLMGWNTPEITWGSSVGCCCLQNHHITISKTLLRMALSSSQCRA